MVRAFVLAAVRVVAVVRVSSICLVFMLLRSTSTEMGIVWSICLKEYFMRSRVVENGITVLSARATTRVIKGTMSLMRAIEGNPYQGILFHP